MIQQKYLKRGRHASLLAKPYIKILIRINVYNSKAILILLIRTLTSPII